MKNISLIYVWALAAGPCSYTGKESAVVLPEKDALPPLGLLVIFHVVLFGHRRYYMQTSWCILSCKQQCVVTSTIIMQNS